MNVPAGGLSGPFRFPRSFEEDDWTVLLQRIKLGRCLPFIGAGASYPTLKLGGQIAEEWAGTHDYPLPDVHDLARVAQYLAVRFDPTFPKGKMHDQLAGSRSPDFSEADEPHAVLADLPLKIYVTTNYDDFMVAALQSRKRAPFRDYCRWSPF